MSAFQGLHRRSMFEKWVARGNRLIDLRDGGEAYFKPDALLIDAELRGWVNPLAEVVTQELGAENPLPFPVIAICKGKGCCRVGFPMQKHKYEPWTIQPAPANVPGSFHWLPVTEYVADYNPDLFAELVPAEDPLTG